MLTNFTPRSCLTSYWQRGRGLGEIPADILERIDAKLCKADEQSRRALEELSQWIHKQKGERRDGKEEP
jgi:hypothetical protein